MIHPHLSAQKASASDCKQLVFVGLSNHYYVANQLFLGTRSLISPIKAIHASGRIDQLLLAGEKRMTFRANFDMQVFAKRRTGLERVSTRTAHRDLVIFRMNFLFHCSMYPLYRYGQTAILHQNRRKSQDSTVHGLFSLLTRT